MANDMGAQAMYRMSKALKDAGKTGKGSLRNQFHADVREAAKPLLPKVRRSAGNAFPLTGGLSAHMAKGTRYRTVVKTGAATAGVSIRANKTDPRADTEGRIAHPVPQRDGRPVLDPLTGRRVSVVQYFPDAIGWFSDPLMMSAGEVREELLRRLRSWATDFERKLR
jgi:hypothetical protein